ncbi:hypothetical protein QYF36_001136 [Acer negundo]|nr:hypothetical protein QYF36_001136 [Acer negundo]
MGVDERDKVPVWQWRLVEDLDAFDAFPWGAHVYRRSIFCFKHALDGRRERFEQRQQERGVDVHTTETYNIYGLLHALLIFAFEVIPELGNKKCGTRMAISELPPPCILKWELSQRPWERKLDGIFTERHERRRSAGPSDTEGAYFRPSDRESPYFGPSDRDVEYSGTNDTEGSDQKGRSRSWSPVRHQPIRFTLLRQPRLGGDSDPEGRSESPKRHRRVDVMEAVRKSDEKRDQQHQELLDMIRAL